MITPNMHYADLKDSYLFYHIAQKTNAYLEANPGKHLYRMGIGDVSLPLCDAVIKALHEAVDDQADKERFHGYMPECGAPFLREIIQDHYHKRGIDLAYEEVFVSSGASDELGDILDLFDKSSSALVIEPAYPAYVDANVIAGRKIIHLASGKVNGFLPEPDEETKADLIYICSPNNPTGCVYGEESLSAVYKAVKGRDIFVICDDVYKALCYTDDYHSFAENRDLKEQILVVQSFSKPYAMTGWRMGYLMADHSVKERLELVHQFDIVSTPAMFQKACMAALETDPSYMLTEYKARRDYLISRLRDAGMELTVPEGAFYAFPDISKYRMDSMTFARHLLDEAGVAVTPGAAFGSDRHVRISYCCSMKAISEGMDRLEQFLSSL